MNQFTFEVSPDQHGLRLDKFLAGEVPNTSRAQLQRLIDEGRVTVARVPVPKANTQVRDGDRITLDVPDTAPSTLVAEDLPLPILYDDADLVVVNKPAGLVVHPGAGHATGTLVHALLHHVKDLSGIGHAIIGDAVYGGVHKRVAHDVRAVQRLTRPFLHAERLAFTHPDRSFFAVGFSLRMRAQP